MKYIFISTMANDMFFPKYIVCLEILANESIKPAQSTIKHLSFSAFIAFAYV